MILQFIQKHKNLLYFICLLVGMHVLPFLVLLGIDQLGYFTYEQESLILLVMYPPIYVIAILLTARWLKMDLHFGLEPLPANLIFNAIILGLSLFIVSLAIDWPFLESIGQGVLKFLTIRAPLQGHLRIDTFTILSIFVGPILEEILFRRMMYSKLAEQYGYPIGILVTSFLFALMHLDVEGLLAYFFVGIVFTYLYHLTKCLWLNILVHALVNLLVRVTSITTYQTTDSMFVIGILIYISCAIAIFLTMKTIKTLT